MAVINKMLNIITFKGKNNRRQFIKYSEALRRKKIFHKAKMLSIGCTIIYKDNIRGLELIDVE